MVHWDTYFFFQAEDGIRDYKVTGVQTCALPISWLARRSPNSSALALGNAVINATAAVNPPSAATVPIFRLLVIGPPKTKVTHAKEHVPLIIRIITNVSRSEERRVGKECRSRWSP